MRAHHAQGVVRPMSQADGMANGLRGGRMRLIHKLELARAGTRNALAKIRNARPGRHSIGGLRNKYDDVERLLSEAVTRIELLIQFHCELEKLKRLPDDKIDTSDIPEVKDFSNFKFRNR